MSRVTVRPSSRSIPHHPRRVVAGFKLPDDRAELTESELAWVELLRAMVGDADPQPTLAGVQALHRALSRE